MAIENILVFGKDITELAKALGISGEEVDSIKTFSLEENELYAKILKELRIFNTHLSIMTNNSISDIEVEDHKSRL